MLFSFFEAEPFGFFLFFLYKILKFFANLWKKPFDS